jgi:hypothetical protein
MYVPCGCGSALRLTFGEAESWVRTLAITIPPRHTIPIPDLVLQHMLQECACNPNDAHPLIKLPTALQKVGCDDLPSSSALSYLPFAAILSSVPPKALVVL